MHAKLLSGRCRPITFRTVNFLQIARNLYETHYEVLNLKKDCTNQEIKDAFIKLSKQYHPDTTKCPNSHSKFVRIAEAYNVLIKPDLRRSYDLGLAMPRSNEYGNVYYNDEYTTRGTADDPIFWKNRDKSRDKYYEREPYYGIKGLKKVSNGTIVLLCMLFTAFGVTLQVILINASVTLKRDKMLKSSAEAEKILADLQEEANRNGNKIQLERLQKRFEEQNLRRMQE